MLADVKVEDGHDDYDRQDVKDEEGETTATRQSDHRAGDTDA